MTIKKADQIKAGESACKAIDAYLQHTQYAIDALKAVVKLPANGAGRKVVEDHILGIVKKEGVSSKPVVRLRALFAKIDVPEGQPNWTFKVGKDGKTKEPNAVHIQKAVKRSDGGAKNGKAKGIAAVKDLQGLLEYAINTYGYEETAIKLASMKDKWGTVKAGDAELWNRFSSTQKAGF